MLAWVTGAFIFKPTKSFMKTIWIDWTGPCAGTCTRQALKDFPFVTTIFERTTVTETHYLTVDKLGLSADLVQRDPMATGVGFEHREGAFERPQAERGFITMAM